MTRSVPRILDEDGRLEVDLHGLTVDDALDWSARLVREAARRGRSSIRLIHGTSTTATRSEVRTIKTALQDWLSARRPEAVSSVWLEDASCLLGLRRWGSPDPRPIRILDLL